MSYDHWKTTNPEDANLGPEWHLEQCPYCGGDESKCDYDFANDYCSEMSLEELRAVNAQRHYDAALAARTEIEDRMVRQVKARVMEIVDAVTL